MFVKASCMVICWIAMAGLGYGQAKKTPPKMKAAAGKTTPVKKVTSNTLLWKISGKGLQKPSYLFGTMHILCAGDANLSDSMKAVIKNCDEIYFELDMDNMGEMMGAMKYLRMNDQKKISELLTKEEYERVEKYFNENGLPLKMMDRFKPIVVSTLIGEQMMKCDKKNGMEEQIIAENKKYDKEIRGLESVQFQASIFDSIPYDKQAKDLVNYIDSIDSYRKVTLEMIDVYKKQDLKRMDSLVHKSDPGMEQYMDILLYNRNRQWVQAMPGIMEKKTILFAVGAGHLPGNQGVIHLLKKEGYTVTPMKN
jgi:uncharacterized protein YbaP (TraB family)